MMNYFKKLIWLIPLILLTACPVPDVSKYSKLSMEMTEAIKKSSTNVVDFLMDALSSQSHDENAMDSNLMEDIEDINGSMKTDKPKDYPKILNKSLKDINKTLDAFVAYSDALVGIKEAGSKGKESFNSLANSLNNLLNVTGIPPISEFVTTTGKYLYGAIAEVRAANKLEDVILNADTVVQYVSIQLDSAIFNLEIINNVAKSEYLLNTVDNEESQQIKELYESLLLKENRNRSRIILLNDYENGDFGSLLYFLYEDVVSLNKLQIDSLTREITKIYDTGGLSPQERVDKIAIIAKNSYNNEIKNQILKPHIDDRLNLAERRIQIQNELIFNRNELKMVKIEFNQLNEIRKDIEEVYKLNAKLLGSTRKSIKSWAKYHRNMGNFLSKKQAPSFNELQLYVNEINEFHNEIIEIKKEK